MNGLAEMYRMVVVSAYPATSQEIVMAPTWVGA
jgi:hypothetical protein